MSRNPVDSVTPSSYSQITTHPRKVTMKKFAPLILVAGLALTGCSSAEQVEVDPSLCLEVPEDIQSEIASAYSGVPMTPVKASAFKSPDYPSAYLIALEFSAPGGDNEVGVWSTSTLEDAGGPIHSVDGGAKAFTSWKKANESVVPLDSTSSGVDESKACLANS